MKSLKQLKHFYFRFGFGLTPSEYLSLDSQNFENIFNRTQREYLDIAFPIEPETLSGEALSKLSEDEKRIAKREARKYKANLNKWWLDQMILSHNPILEKMTLFWHGHFACRPKNNYTAYQYLVTLRKHSLGNLKDFVKAISIDPAMLQFLNGNKNKKNAPNENYARELLELFTLGVGHYKESDIREAAKAFTGWGIEKKQGYKALFKRKNHDDGFKTFMGHTGRFNMEDIIEIIFKQKRTATFIATKFYKYFVNEIVNNNHVDELANAFYDSDYEIFSLIEKTIYSNWFYDDMNLGNRIKSPIEFLVTMFRHTYGKVERANEAILLQKLFSQQLFYPPNVAGWKGGKQWINSVTLIHRRSLVSYLNGTKSINYKPKTEPEKEEEQLHQIKLNGITIDITKSVKKVNEANLVDYLLAPSLSYHSDKTSNSKYHFINILESLEYQLC